MYPEAEVITSTDISFLISFAINKLYLVYSRTHVSEMGQVPLKDMTRKLI